MLLIFFCTSPFYPLLSSFSLSFILSFSIHYFALFFTLFPALSHLYLNPFHRCPSILSRSVLKSFVPYIPVFTRRNLRLRSSPPFLFEKKTTCRISLKKPSETGTTLILPICSISTYYTWCLSSSQILSPWLRDVVDCGLGLSYRPASLCSLASRYDNPRPQSALSPQSGTINLTTAYCWR